MGLVVLSPDVPVHESPLVPETVHDTALVVAQVTRTGVPMRTKAGFTVQVVTDGPDGAERQAPEEQPNEHCCKIALVQLFTTSLPEQMLGHCCTHAPFWSV